MFGLLGLGGLGGLLAPDRTRRTLGSLALFALLTTGLALGAPAGAQQRGHVGEGAEPYIGTGSGQKLPQQDVSGYPSSGNPGSGSTYEGAVGKDAVNTNSLRSDGGKGQWGMLGLLGLAGLVPLLLPREAHSTRSAADRERRRGTA